MGSKRPTTKDTGMIDATALHDMEGKIDELPLLPQVLVQLLQLDPKSDDYFEQFERLAKEDPPFAVRVLALANSAASAPAVPIVNIRDAITRMGAATISSLVASLAVQQVFMPTKPSQVRLWNHSVTTAVATQQIACLMPDLQIDHGQAYLSGLLHDIGRFVMLEHASPDLLRVDESNWDSPEELIDAELQVYKFTHSELGYLACRHWGLPDAVSHVARHHHDPIEEPIDRNSENAIVYSVQMADKLCIALLERPDLDDMTSEDREQRILKHCLRSEEDQRRIAAAELCARIDSISLESDTILSGLGFVH